MALLRRRRGGAQPTGTDDANGRGLSESTLPAIPEDWLPDEVLKKAPGSGAADARTASEWVPAGLPASEPSSPRRKRSSGAHQVPPGMQPPEERPPAAREDRLIQELRHERDELVREQRELRRSLERIQAELAATHGAGAGASPDAAAAEPAAPSSPAASPEPAAPGGRININTAPAEQLMRLAGVGRRAAERIVEYRDEHGPFVSVQALVHVDGFHPDRIKRFIDQATI